MDNRHTVIQKHFKELVEQYPGLALIEGDHGEWIIQGLLEFVATYKSISIRDKFQIEITVTEDYPNTPPIAKETDGRIPKKFHTNYDESLCLGAPLEVRRKFAQNPSLFGFVYYQVIPFLYSYCYFEQYKEMPFGELPHNERGILEYYKQLFNVTSEIVALEILKILAENYYKGHHDCPCSSKKQIRECHGKLLREISSCQNPDEFLCDYVYCLVYLEKSGEKLPKSLTSKKIMNRIKKYGRKLEKNKKHRVAPIL